MWKGWEVGSCGVACYSGGSAVGSRFACTLIAMPTPPRGACRVVVVRVGGEARAAVAVIEQSLDRGVLGLVRVVVARRPGSVYRMVEHE